ncbi:hypothetical protein AB0J86_05955 [Micromonospora sp. NPDC049559]|uniref:MGH1-like glycoside hydrolase domain-containing protein n=1 Tax=Micromonospora sp. NPDC049559 TaxID=3155923 RepID=UPI003433E531
MGHSPGTGRSPDAGRSPGAGPAPGAGRAAGPATRTLPVEPPDGLDPADRELWRTVAEVLETNWSRDHTVPSRTLYPHQWSWDAGFIAVGLAHVAPERGWRDLRSLFSAQWPDGRVPHIVFDPEVTERDYFPGPTFWAAPAMDATQTAPATPAVHTVPTAPAAPTAPAPPAVHAAPVAPAARAGTTGIVQPPIHALGAWALYRHARDPEAVAAGVAELRWLYPRLVAQQDYLAGPRDVGGAGLSSIVHPWESGLDNSPSWDAALAAVPVTMELLHRYRRRDVGVVAAVHRPTDEDYARYLGIAAAYRDGGYRDADLAGRHPFLVECPAFNTLRAAAELALAEIATVVGADPAPHRARAAAITAAVVDRLHDPGTGMFHALDVRTGRLSPARCVNGLLPLLLPGLPAARAAALVEVATSACFGLTERMPVPSYDRAAADFDPLRYWRGPVWTNMNWLLWRGLRTHGRDDLAATLRTALLDLVRRSGCYEYFHADTGQGIGAPAFSWTAALTLDLLAER